MKKIKNKETYNCTSKDLSYFHNLDAQNDYRLKFEIKEVEPDPNQSWIDKHPILFCLIMLTVMGLVSIYL